MAGGDAVKRIRRPYSARSITTTSFRRSCKRAWLRCS